MVRLQQILGVRPHVAIAAEMCGADHALLAVRAQLAFSMALACHDQPHGEPPERLSTVTELTHFEPGVISLGWAGALA